METKISELIAVQISFPELESRTDAWGRITHLSAIGARLLTRFRFQPGERLLLTFRVGAEDFERLEAGIWSVGPDSDGYRVIDLRFPSEADKLRLGRALRSLLQ